MATNPIVEWPRAPQAKAARGAMSRAATAATDRIVGKEAKWLAGSSPNSCGAINCICYAFAWAGAHACHVSIWRARAVLLPNAAAKCLICMANDKDAQATVRVDVQI